MFQQTIKLNPNDARFFNNLANTQSSLCKLREAELNYKKAISLDNSYAEAYSNLGDTYKLSQKNIKILLKIMKKHILLIPK